MVEVSKDGLADYRHKLWMVACHASGGGIPEIEGVDRPTNDICVQISAHHNAIWKLAQETAAENIATLQAERDRYRVALEDVLAVHWSGLARCHEIARTALSDTPTAQS